MNLFTSIFALLIGGVFGAGLQKRERRDEICPCPEHFEKAPGIPFKCFLARESNRSATEAKKYCEGRYYDAILNFQRLQIFFFGLQTIFLL